MPFAKLRPPPAVALTATAALLVAGCGSQTKTVSVGGSATAQTTQTLANTTQSQPAKTSTTTTTRAPAETQGGGTPAPSTTRSAPEPAFTEGKSPAGAAAAVALLRARGYVPEEPAQYHPSQTLQVLVGRPAQSGDGYGQRAFFFIDGRYIGTDSSEPSATVRVVSQADTEVALAYPLYRRNDPLCCPSGGQATVRFQLNNGRLVPLGTIPPTSRSAGLSRY